MMNDGKSKVVIGWDPSKLRFKESGRMWQGEGVKERRKETTNVIFCSLTGFLYLLLNHVQRNVSQAKKTNNCHST